MTEKDFFDESDSGVEWGTPEYIVEPLSNAINGFDLDPASGAEPKPYAKKRYTEEDNGLSKNWFGHVWLNPPYGREYNLKWAKKSERESKVEEVKSITALIPASTSTSWFQEFYAKADVFCFFDHRINFIGTKKQSATFSNVICCFGREELNNEYFSQLEEFGTVMVSGIQERSVFDF
jgi:phage N-6-adenine-methyltransferase